MKKKATTPKLLVVGDVLKTHPTEGYWGCAIVLTAQDKTDRFDPMCHIAVTTTIFRHDYAFSELDISSLQVLQFDRQIRLAPDTYAPLHRQTCIGIYSRKMNQSVVVIGNTDVSFLAPKPLGFEVGEGVDGRWPLCGPVRDQLGSEAVASWRAVRDNEQWLEDVAAARMSHEQMLVRLKEREKEERQKRQEAKR